MPSAFKSNAEIFTFAAELIEHARQLGDEETAVRIEEALKKAGTSPSEQLGELKIAFSSIQADMDGYPEEITSKIASAISAIEDAFRRANRPFF